MHLINGVSLHQTTDTPPLMPDILTLSRLGKTYASGHVALKNVDLTIRRGEIFALLGPNGDRKSVG